MKITVVCPPSSEEMQDAWTYFQKILTPLNHLVWLKNLKETGFHEGGKKKFSLECLPQGETLETIELAEKIKDHLYVVHGIDVLDMVVYPTMQIEAITANNNDSFTVDPYFAVTVAKNKEFRQTLQSKNIVKVTLEYEQINPHAFQPTGKIATQFKGEGSIPFDPENVYHCIAAAISLNKSLQNKLRNEKIEKIQVTHQEKAVVKIDVMASEVFQVTLPSPGTLIYTNLDELTESLQHTTLTHQKKFH